MPNSLETFETGSSSQPGAQPGSEFNFLDLQDKKPPVTRDSLLERLKRNGPSQTTEGTQSNEPSPSIEETQPTEKVPQQAQQTQPIIDKDRDWTEERNVAEHALRNFKLFDTDNDEYLSRKELAAITENSSNTWNEKDKYYAKYILNNFDTVKNFYDDGDGQTGDGQWQNSNASPSTSKTALGISLRDTQVFGTITSPNFDPASAARWDTWDIIKKPLLTMVGSGAAAGLLYAFEIRTGIMMNLARLSMLSGIYVVKELANNSTRREQYYNARSISANLTKAERFG